MAPSPYPHYVWAFGHFTVLLASLWYFKAYVTFKSAAYVWYYRAAFFGAITSYAIVCYKSLGIPQPNYLYLQRALVDENVQYFAMAFLWWYSRPVPIALVPYFVFSLFHTLTFVRTNLLPLVLPPRPPATTNGSPAPASPQSPIAKTIQTWVKNNYDPAMAIVARIELLILLRAILGVITFQNGIVIPLAYAHFLRIRYYGSGFTRDAIQSADTLIKFYVDKEQTPPVVKRVHASAKQFIVHWASARIEPQPAAAAATERR